MQYSRWVIIRVVLVSMAGIFAMPCPAQNKTVTCESISQTETAIPAGGNMAVLLAAAPPGVTGIKINLYARWESQNSWSSCGSYVASNGLQITATCLKAITFLYFKHTLIPPEGYHSYQLNAVSGGCLPGQPCGGPARMGVQYDSPDGKCVATQIVELGPRDRLETWLLVPPGKQATAYRWYQKTNLEPPQGISIPNWKDCQTQKCDVLPTIISISHKVDGADHGEGFNPLCTNRTNDNPPNYDLAHDACRIDIPYTP